jgi:nucleoside-diphosphate-sugar epimerase
MKTFLIGATGVLGRETLPLLRAAGHQVVALARTPEAEKTLAAQGVEPIPGTIYDPAALQRGARDADAVLHLATRIPQKPIPRLADFAENDRLRTEGARLLADAARRAGARALLFQSIAFIFPDCDAAEVTEDSQPYDHPLVRTALEGERATLRSGLRGVALRGGYFFHRGAYHTNWMAEQLRKRRLPLIGRGDALMNLVHPRDLARAFLLAAENPNARGVYHVAAQPVEARILFTEWARRLGARPPRHIPHWLARLVMGDFGKLAAFRYRVSSEKTQQQLGFTFEFPTYEEILDHLTAA